MRRRHKFTVCNLRLHLHIAVERQCVHSVTRGCHELPGRLVAKP